MGPRALDVLGVLVERAGNLVTKEEIMAAVWARAVVENANLTVQISALRRILDQGRSEGSCIQTVAARGYRFVAPVTRFEQATGSAAAALAISSGINGPAAILIPERTPRAIAISDAPSAQAAPARTRRRRLALVGFAVGLAVLILVAAAAWRPRPAPSTSAPATAGATARPTNAPRLSIVVLPFADLSEGVGQQYFADGVTDDLTTDLSRLRNVLVISRNTAFTYKDKNLDAKQIGRELGVRYVLEGSVRRSGNEVRINAQLIDAATNTHIWAERFDHDIGNLFAIQNEITSRIANTLGWELISAETARPTDRPDALDYLLRGRAVIGTGLVRENIEKAVDLYERALALDPNSVEAQSRLAGALIIRAAAKDPGSGAADRQRAEELIARALAISPGDPLTHRVKGLLLRTTRRCEQAIPEFEIALAADRNNPFALHNLSICKYLTGGSDNEAIALTEQAIRLSPRDPVIGAWYSWIGFVHLLQSRVDEAIVWLEKSRSLDPRA